MNPIPYQTDLKGPMFQPRPGWGGRFKNWLKTSAVIPLIAVLAVLGVGIGIITDQIRHRENNKETSTTQNSVPDHYQPSVSGAQNHVYIVAARIGEGITHLARRAIRMYLQDHTDIRLIPEQKIYAEDYLKDLKGSRWLAFDEAMTFRESEISSAVAASLILSKTEIKSLAHYLPLVPDLEK